MKIISVLAICFASVLAEMQNEDPLPYPSEVQDSTAVTDAKPNDQYCHDCDHDFEEAAIKLSQNRVEPSSFTARRILALISDHHAGRLVDFCSVMDLLSAFAYHGDEETYIQGLTSDFSQGYRAKFMSNIEATPKCKKTGVKLCEYQACRLQRQMRIVATYNDMLVH